MTVEADFKQLIRRHMAATGLSYQAARRSLLEQRSEENAMTTTTSRYGSETIQRPASGAPSLDEIRSNPRDFIIDTGPAGIAHLALELVMNSIDEFTAGHATNVFVAVGEDGSIYVRDDGRGLPVEPTGPDTRSALELVFLELGTSAKRTGSVYPVPAGTNGMGLPVVAALSERVQVWVERDGRRYEAEFASSDDHPGQVVQPVTETGRAGLGRTTAIQFWPDRGVFGDARIDIEDLTDRLELLSAVSDGLVISLATPQQSPRVVARKGQLGSLLESSSTSTRKLIRDDGMALIALADSDDESTVVRSFANGIETVGGDHVEAALASAPPRSAMIVSVWVKHPDYRHADGGGCVLRDETARALVEAALTASTTETT